METKNIQPSFEDSLISFSYDIYREIGNDGSTCVSPYSIISALLLLMAGTAGNSKSQIKSAILKNKWDDHVIYDEYGILKDYISYGTKGELYVATKLFVMNGLTVTTGVRDVAKGTFDADISFKDFRKPKISAHHMNRYISKRTNEKIKDLISWKWLNDNTIMVLANAVYFKGTWEREFYPKNTRKADFFLKNTKTEKLQVDMMAMKSFVNLYDGKNYSAITLPYKGGSFEMMIVLPKEIEGLKDLQMSFSPDDAKHIDKNLKNVSAVIKIPKFTFSAATNLKTLLPKVGIKDIFKEGVANFSNLVNEVNRRIYVSEARHKVVIDVNEKGTEAAGATALVVERRSKHQPRFVADHPFMFYIRHGSTGTILFMGHFNPKK